MKTFKKLATLLLSLAIVCGVTACLPDISSETGSSSTGSASVVDPTTYEYSLNLSSFSLDVGATRTLRVFVEPEKELTVDWQSENEGIATVDNAGTVTGIAEGTTTVTATVDGQVLECEVTVNPLPIVYEYALDQTSKQLTIGDELQLNVTATPEPENMPSVTWTSSANSVATVSTNGLVKAVGVGSAVITAVVEESTLTCEITVTSPVTATATVASPERANLSNNHESLDTLYWEHYSPDGERAKLFAKDYITTNILEICTNNFWDYRIPLSYNDGTVNLAYANNTNGIHTPGGEEATIEFVVSIDEKVKAIRVYASAWNATNTVTLEWDGIVIATAESIQAGGDPIAKEITFTIDEIDPSITSLTVKVTASSLNGGNVAAPAVVILGDAGETQSAVEVEFNKTAMPDLVNGNPENEIFLTEYGTQDWIYLNKFDVERKNGGNMILTDSLEVEGNNSFDDYKGNFTWTNGTVNAISSGVNNDGQFGAWATVKTKVNANTTHVYFWVGGYSSTYYFEVYDSQGNLLVSELLAEEVSGYTHSYMLDLAIATETEETLMLNIYRTGGLNCSIAALAVYEEVEYTYTLEQSEIELQAETTWSSLKVSATPDRRFQVSYRSENENVAKVDANGVITGVAEGETNIIVLIDGEETNLTAKVKVTPAPIEYVYTLTSSLEMMPGQTTTLTVEITPSPTETPAIEWSSNYPDIVSVEKGVLTAKENGEATITATVDGKVLTCVVTVETKITATATTTEETPYEVSLTDNDATLDTIYWEHYAGTSTNGSLNGEDVINVVPGGSSFSDFNVRFNWFDGNGARVGNHDRNGSYTSGNHVVEAQIAVNSNVKAIRVYVGAWKATNTVSLLYNGIPVATANAFTADGNSVAKEITFAINVTEDLTLTLKVEGSNVEGNVSLNAIVLLGSANRANAVASLALEKTSLIIPEGERKDVDLTSIGNLDWFYPETDFVSGEPWDPDYKANGNYIDESSFAMSFYTWFGDFGYDRVYFNWTDGTNYPTVEPSSNRNDGRWGSIASISTKVDANVKHVYLWTSGWNCSYSVAVLDSKGNIIFNEEIVQSQGNNQPFVLNFAVNCAVEETLSFVLYGTSSDNCSIVAMAVSGTPDYDYTANLNEVTLYEQETAEFKISASPAKDMQVLYSTSNESVAKVDQYGVITAIAEGNAVITASVDGKTFECAVTVNPRPLEYTYSLNVSERELIPNQTLQLEVTVSPSKEMNLTYVSANEGIAEVDTNGLITAKANGVVRLDVLDNGVVVAECTITVKTYVTAGETTVVEGYNVDLTFASETHTTLYWERYRDNKAVEQMANATDMIPYASIVENGSGFGDYKAAVNWSNGKDTVSWFGNTSGLCYGGITTVTINVTPAVKQIVVYTGAWNASAYATLSQNETAIATSATFETGGDGIARFVTFNLTVLENTTLTLTLTPTSSSGGNASLTAIAILGDKPATATTLAFSKEELPLNFVQVDDKNQPSVSYNLTEVGTTDWLYTNYEGNGTDEMANANAIDTASLKWEGDGKFWDYKAIFTWTNGTTWQNNEKDSDTTYGTNNGICGAWIAVNVNVDASTNKVELFVGGYSSTYYLMVLDSNGTILSNEFMHEEVRDTTYAYRATYSITATTAETLTFIVYRTTGSNCSLAAITVA